MPSALQAFVAEPSKKSYLRAREELLTASERILDATLLDPLTLLHDAGDMTGLSAALAALPPIAALTPRVHYYAALAAEARHDDDDLELERMLLVVCLRALLMTGDGSPEQPYVVSALCDENDLLESLELAPETRRLVHRGDSVFDVVTCDEGSEIWFDVSALVRIPAESTVATTERAKRHSSRPKAKASRRLSQTRH